MVYPKKQEYWAVMKGRGGNVIVSNIYIAVSNKIEVLLVRTKLCMNGLYLAVAATVGKRKYELGFFS